MLPREAPEHNYIVHDDDLPLPGFLADLRYHGIVLGPTFLCNRFHDDFLETLDRYAFIRDSDAFKLALPQDDYYSSAVLDRWLMHWRVDRVDPVCPQHWDVLYPLYSQSGGQMQLGFTGYVSEELVERWRHPKPRARRAIDVSYRSHDLSARFGRLAYAKARIGEVFEASTHHAGLNTDISVRPQDMIPGEQWRAFVEDSRFCLVASSGCSLLDPEGALRRRVSEYMKLHPHATFAEVEEICFKGLDGRYVFTALSPRNIEAALAKTVQIATPDEYSGILQAGEHYVPFETDGSNVAEVLAAISDVGAMDAMADACKTAILDQQELRYTHRAASLIAAIDQAASERRIRGTDTATFEQHRRRYLREVVARSEKIWQRRRQAAKTREVVTRLGLGAIKRGIRRWSQGS